MNATESWLAEKRSAYLYRLLAQKEKSSANATLFAQLADAAEEQALVWEKQITAAGGVAKMSLGLRARIVALLIRILSPKHLKGALAAIKIRGVSVYTNSIPGHPFPQTVEDVGLRHASLKSGGNLRAAVFGINDGLVSNAALIFGMAGAASDNGYIILVAGVAGLLAGAFSMAAGEYVSVLSQKEMMEYQIGLEKEEFELYPEEEQEELALIYQARGLTQDEARKLAAQMMSDPQKALDALTREELGIDPTQLASPIQAAIFSFIAFGFGAFIPLTPFLFSAGPLALIISAVSTGISLFTVGMLISLFVGKQAIKGGIRMLLVGGAAGTITYFIGTLFGVSVG